MNENFAKSGSASLTPLSGQSLPPSDVSQRSGAAGGFSRWRNIPRRVRRILSRCRSLLSVPERIDQLTSRSDVEQARIEGHLSRITDDQARVRETLIQITDDQARVRETLVQITDHQLRVYETLARITDDQPRIQETLTRITDDQAQVHETLGRITDEQVRLGAAVRAELAAISPSVGDSVNRLQLELSTEMAFSLHDIAQRLIGQPVQAEVNRLANEQFEAKNQLIHLGTNTASLLQNLTTIASETRNAALHAGTNTETRLDTIEYERLDGLYEQLHYVTAGLLGLRAGIEANRSQRSQQAAERYAPAQRRPLEADLQRAKAEFPQIYPMWAERLDEMRQACIETKVGNVAHAGDPRSEAFRSFVEIHAAGRVLDVGCGVFGRPFYLSSYSAALISGLDPLEPMEPPDFEFVRGIQEYLPWPDGSFSTVISATALDHCLSLDRSLAEIRRVLCPDGRFLLWIDSLRGSPRFAPDAPDFAPADRFHLFHFDTAWFEPMLNEWFDVVDRVLLRGTGFDRAMWCLQLRQGRVITH